MGAPSILLVDDDSALLAGLSDFLAFHLPGVRVDIMESPRIALARITARPYHVLITDLCMSPFTGLELLRGAKAIRPDMPVIIFSSRLDASVRSQAFRLGAYDMLPKGDNPHELLGVLKDALGLRHLSRTVRAKHLLLHRLQKRIHDIMRRLNANDGGPLTSRPSTFSTPAGGQSCADLESMLDVLWISGRRLETLRDETDAHLKKAYHVSQERCLHRMDSRVSDHSSSIP